MTINSRAEASNLINEAYAKVRDGHFQLPGEDPAILMLLQDIEEAEVHGPEIHQLEKELYDLRLSLQYKEEGTDVSDLERQEAELESRLQQIQAGQGICSMAFEVRDLLRAAGKIDNL